MEKVWERGQSEEEEMDRQTDSQEKTDRGEESERRE